MARPTKYTKQLAELICDKIASSSYGLSTICKDESLPNRSTVRNWIRDIPEFLDLYTRAKEDQADFLADEMLELADISLKTEIEYSGDNGSSITIQDNVQRSRLQIETRKWLAMKLQPKKYGDKLDVEHTSRVITVKVPGEDNDNSVAEVG